LGCGAKAIAALTWAIADAAGQVAEALHPQNHASKGKTCRPRPEQAGLCSERGGGLSPMLIPRQEAVCFAQPNLYEGEDFSATLSPILAVTTD